MIGTGGGKLELRQELRNAGTAATARAAQRYSRVHCGLLISSEEGLREAGELKCRCLSFLLINDHRDRRPRNITNGLGYPVCLQSTTVIVTAMTRGSHFY